MSAAELQLLMLYIHLLRKTRKSIVVIQTVSVLTQINSSSV